MPPVPRWSIGPFELLVHAEEHFRRDGDIDRRLCMIGFDNAIESGITTYLSLKPEQRQGRTYSQADRDGWLKDFPSRIEFLYEELKARDVAPVFEKADVLWFRSIRNEMYHSGLGVVPHGDCVKGIREAALWIVGALFEIEDIETYVFEEVEARIPTRNPEFDASFDEANAEVDIGGLVYSPSDVLFSVDPRLYRQYVLEYGETVLALAKEDDQS